MTPGDGILYRNESKSYEPEISTILEADVLRVTEGSIHVHAQYRVSFYGITAEIAETLHSLHTPR